MIKEISIVLSLIPGSVRQCQMNKFHTWMENGVYSIYPLYEILVSYLCVHPVTMRAPGNTTSETNAR
jgi:hypothetical protein